MTTASPSRAPVQPWHPLARVALRFALIYFALYAAAPELLWDPIVRLVGPGVLGVEVRYRPNGSGDTTYSYVQVLVVFVAASVGCVIWSALDRRRLAYPRLAEWLLVAARYYLGVMMVAYGLAKLFCSQFPEPSLTTLIQPYGDASPMGLAWVFMGQSPTYQAFTGLLELVAGLLLFWRRTTTLGALLGAAVMSNVVMLNFCFDIPVKLLSSHLLLLALVIAAADGRRLLAALLGLAPTRPLGYPPHFRGRKLHVAGRILKAVVIAGALLVSASLSSQAVAEYGSGAPRSPYYGIYEVTELREDGHLRPALLDDGERWRYLVFEHLLTMTIVRIDGSAEHHWVDADADAGTLVVHTGGPEPFSQFLLDPPPPTPYEDHTWQVVEIEPGELQITGSYEGRQLDLRLVRVEREFLLRSRGFRWINETPLNR